MCRSVEFDNNYFSILHGLFLSAAYNVLIAVNETCQLIQSKNVLICFGDELTWLLQILLHNFVFKLQNLLRFCFVVYFYFCIIILKGDEDICDISLANQ